MSAAPLSDTPPASPLGIPDFRAYLLARFCAVVATMAMVVIIGYQVYDVARDDYGMSVRAAAFQLGLVGLVQFVPLALLTPVAGWVADRFERRRVAQCANMVDMGVALALGWFTYADALTLPILFLLAALHGVARAFVGPAMSAIAPNIVPPALLPQAIALSSIAWQAGSVIGPAVGGFLYAADGALTYWVAAALLALATVSIGMVRPVHPPPPAARRHPLREMVDGLVFTWRDQFLFAAITLDLFAVLLGSAVAMLPVFARDILFVGTDGLGLLRAAPAAGAAVVALWLALRPLKHNVGVKMLWAVVVFGLATMGFGLSLDFYLSLAMLVVMGASDMLSVYVRSSLVQLNTPDAMRGRVSAVSGLAISASNELGEMRCGTLAALVGPVAAVVGGGAAAIAVTAVWAWRFPSLRRARTFAPQYRSSG